MQNSPEIESGSHQIREVKIQIPYRRIFRIIAITLVLQTAATAAAAYYLGQSSPDQLFDIGTIVAMVVFIVGTFMMGRFPDARESFVDHMHVDRRPHHMREMSITSKARGAVFMISSILYVLLCMGAGWLAKSSI